MSDPVRILVADSVCAACDEILRRGGLSVDREEAVPEADLPKRIGPYHGVIVRSRIKVTEAAIEAGTNLRIIGRAGTGVDNIDVAAAKARGIEVVNAPGANARSVAEHVFALLFAVLRQVANGCAAMRAGRWDRRHFQGREIAGLTLGILGAGRIGRITGRIGRALGMRVLANSPSATRDPHRRADLVEDGIELADYPVLLAESDVVTVHVPLNDTTRGLLGRREIERMKPTAIVINTSRGEVIDEAALAEALEKGRLGGAGLDVYSAEPPPADSPFRRLPNVVCTPHLAASTEEAQTRAGREIADQFVAFFARR